MFVNYRQQGDAASLVFLCSGIGAAAPSNYVLEWSRWDTDQEALTLLYIA